jgi:hypothetical protein
MPTLAGVPFFETHPNPPSLLGPVLLNSLGITEKNGAGLNKAISHGRYMNQAHVWLHLSWGFVMVKHAVVGFTLHKDSYSPPD